MAFLSEDTITDASDVFGLTMTGDPSMSHWVRTGGSGSPVSSSKYPLWQSANYDRWHAYAAWLDLAASAADAGNIQGRYEATAINPAEAGLNQSGDVSAFSNAPRDLYVLRDYRAMTLAPSDDGTKAGLLIAHVAIWLDYKLTIADVNAMVAGDNPTTIGGGPDYYWPLRDSNDGLSALVGTGTLVATGGNANPTWHTGTGDNPTVDAPSGGASTPRNSGRLMLGIG
jgi:hypothetical protein